MESLRHSLRRGREIGALGVVVHTGSATGGRARAVALAQVRERVLPLLAELTRDDDPWLLLEPTAGQGASLCSLAEDLGPYFEALERHPRLGVCLDTCHAFAAGHDMAAPGGTKATLDELVEVCGEGRLRLIHANDSKDVVGAHKDRHENIGAGHIGAEAFAGLFTHPATEGVPLVIETPGPQGAARGGRGQAEGTAALGPRPPGSQFGAVAGFLLVGVALLAPGVAEVVVAAFLPEAAAVRGHVLDAADPLGALPGVELRDDQSHREAVFHGERLAVAVGGEYGACRRRSRRAAGWSCSRIRPRP